MGYGVLGLFLSERDYRVILFYPKKRGFFEIECIKELVKELDKTRSTSVR